MAFRDFRALGIDVPDNAKVTPAQHSPIDLNHAISKALVRLNVPSDERGGLQVQARAIEDRLETLPELTAADEDVRELLVDTARIIDHLYSALLSRGGSPDLESWRSQSFLALARACGRLFPGEYLFNSPAPVAIEARGPWMGTNLGRFRQTVDTNLQRFRRR